MFNASPRLCSGFSGFVSLASAAWPAKPGGYAILFCLTRTRERPDDERKAKRRDKEVDERPEPELVRAASFRT